MEPIKPSERVSEPNPNTVVWTKQFISKEYLIKMIQKTLSIPDNVLISFDDRGDTLELSYAVKVDL